MHIQCLGSLLECDIRRIPYQTHRILLHTAHTVSNMPILKRCCQSHMCGSSASIAEKCACPLDQRHFATFNGKVYTGNGKVSGPVVNLQIHRPVSAHLAQEMQQLRARFQLLGRCLPSHHRHTAHGESLPTSMHPS